MSDGTPGLDAVQTPRVLIIEARFYEDVSDQLLAGAQAVIETEGLPFDVVTVPGALEIPAALRYALTSQDVSSQEAPAVDSRYEAYVILGCVIRGETSHYDLVCQECSQGVMALSSEYCLALGFGVLTVDHKEQAVARADPQRGDQGGRAARACLRMLALKRQFHLYRP